MYYHRIVMDFSHDIERMEFSDFFDELVIKLMDLLDPHEDDSPECSREVWVSAMDVTEEYDELMENGVTEFKEKLSDDTALDDFFKTITFKDYPPEG